MISHFDPEVNFLKLVKSGDYVENLELVNTFRLLENFLYPFSRTPGTLKIVAFSVTCDGIKLLYSSTFLCSSTKRFLKQVNLISIS